MKKITIGFILIFLVGCGNKDIGIGNYDYNYISCNSDYLPLVNEPIETWKDFDDGEQLEVKLKNYDNNLIVSSFQCVLSKNVIPQK